MTPLWLTWLTSSAAAQLFTRDAGAPNATPETVMAYLAAQWENPNDILSILLLVGPDVVSKAIAQLAGRAITPVAFSFGWVAYAPAALLSSFGGMLFLYLASAFFMVHELFVILRAQMGV